MIRRAILLPLALLAGCGREAPPPKAEPHHKPTIQAATGRQPTEAERRTMGEATAALRHYYDLLEAGDYRTAYRMRTPSRVDEQRFAANFAAYALYRAVPGTPSLPAEAGGFIYVQIPVMITGRFKGGKPFGSSGNVLVRRPISGGGPWLLLVDS
jgi:hypothetical protein